MKPLKTRGLSICGIILAAGKGSRIGGKIKSLLKTGNKTFIEKIVYNMQRSRISCIVVVLGFRSGKVAEFLKKKKLAGRIKIVINKNYAADQFTSLKLAIKAAPEGTKAVMFTPVDHPLTKLTTYRKLVSSWEKDKNKICVPSYHYRKGHPTIFPRRVFKEALTKIITGGARELLKKYSKSVKYVLVDDPNIIRDFDSPADYAAVCGSGTALRH